MCKKTISPLIWRQPKQAYINCKINIASFPLLCLISLTDTLPVPQAFINDFFHLCRFWCVVLRWFGIIIISLAWTASFLLSQFMQRWNKKTPAHCSPHLQSGTLLTTFRSTDPHQVIRQIGVYKTHVEIYTVCIYVFRNTGDHNERYHKFDKVF